MSAVSTSSEFKHVPSSSASRGPAALPVEVAPAGDADQLVVDYEGPAAVPAALVPLGVTCRKLQ